MSSKPIERNPPVTRIPGMDCRKWMYIGMIPESCWPCAPQTICHECWDRELARVGHDAVSHKYIVVTLGPLIATNRDCGIHYRFYAARCDECGTGYWGSVDTIPEPATFALRPRPSDMVKTYPLSDLAQARIEEAFKRPDV